MRAADLPGRLPQAPSGRDQQPRNDCSSFAVAGVNSVPPKEPPPAFQVREDASPKASTRRNLELDPIYLKLPYCFAVLLGNECATKGQMIFTETRSGFSESFASSRFYSVACESNREHGRVHVQYILSTAANDNRSLVQGQGAVGRSSRQEQSAGARSRNEVLFLLMPPAPADCSLPPPPSSRKCVY